MTQEDKIAALLAKAEPLRCLPDEEAEAAGLPEIVDAINRLRYLQSMAEQARDEADFANIEADVRPEPEKRKPGRPKKVAE